MGYYINEDSKGVALGNSAIDKLKGLIEDGAKKVPGNVFEENLVCIVDNGIFGAAAYAYDEEEFEVFKREDGRAKVWITHPKAKELAK